MNPIIYSFMKKLELLYILQTNMNNLMSVDL